MTDFYVSPDMFPRRWRLSREIDDRSGSGTAVFTGDAEISARSKDWVYTENGMLNVPGHRPMKAQRSYYWRPDPIGFDIFFEDQRFFHRFELSLTWATQHWCDPDMYEVTYDLTKWPEWRTRWTVRGPKKDYTMTSHYSFIS